MHRGELDLDPDSLHRAARPTPGESCSPVQIWTSPSGKTLVDFGQNLVGWLRVQVQGPAGSTMTLRHAEVLEHDELGIRPLANGQGHRPVHPQRR